MMNRSRILLSACFILAAGGFLVPLWPLTALGVGLAGLSGRYVSAVVMGLLFDVAYGAPAGMLHAVWFPFTALALVSYLLYLLGRRYLIGHGRQEALR